MQTNKNEEQKQYSSKEGENPKVNVKVNKKYDDKGNLIRYDSTYSYVYSSGGKDSVKESVDSVFKRFRSYYNENFSANMDKKLNELFWNDSLFKYDFMNKDFFSKRFELNEERMDTIFREMDSLKNEFLKKPKKELHGKPRT
jgi:hypothetical protein